LVGIGCRQTLWLRREQRQDYERLSERNTDFEHVVIDQTRVYISIVKLIIDDYKHFHHSHCTKFYGFRVNGSFKLRLQCTECTL